MAKPKQQSWPFIILGVMLSVTCVFIIGDTLYTANSRPIHETLGKVGLATFWIVLSVRMVRNYSSRRKNSN